MTSWENLKAEDLRRLYCDEGLSDSYIAKKFNISKSKVAYKRNKFGISFADKVYKRFISENKDLFDKLNLDSKERLLVPENIDAISKAITHYAFRNGPVEDIHCNGQLSDANMYVLNKYMVNRLAGLLTAIANNDWLKIEILLDYYTRYSGSDWDKAEPDMEEIEDIWEMEMKKWRFSDSAADA